MLARVRNGSTAVRAVDGLEEEAGKHMNKRDYLLVGETLLTQYRNTRSKGFGIDAENAIEDCVYALADAFMDADPGFDRLKFLTDFEDGLNS